MADQKKQQKQFVLVHGSNHGAWCWYKLKPLLEAAGHHVTVLDLTAAGINIRPVQDVYTLYEYTKPLLEILASLPPDEKVILVGHSFGGLSLALASDMFPQKIFVAVFLTAFMPDTTHQPSYVMDKLREMAPNQTQLDAQFEPYDSSDPDSPLSILIGPKMLANNLYQLSPVEDLELAKVLVRPGPLLPHELSKAKPFSKKGYGSVSKVYIVCGEDKCMLKEFQYWMIENIHVDHVMEIPNADHMPMFSTTQELFERLSDVSTLYA